VGSRFRCGFFFCVLVSLFGRGVYGGLALGVPPGPGPSSPPPPPQPAACCSCERMAALFLGSSLVSNTSHPRTPGHATTPPRGVPTPRNPSARAWTIACVIAGALETLPPAHLQQGRQGARGPRTRGAQTLARRPCPARCTWLCTRLPSHQGLVDAARPAEAWVHRRGSVQVKCRGERGRRDRG
jgi:hypothetical protein